MVAGLVSEPPARERLEASGSVEHLWVAERGHGKPGRVGHHLFESDGRLAVRSELGDHVGDNCPRRQQAFPDQLPDRAGKNGSTHRLEDVPLIVRRRSDSLERDQLIVFRHRPLHRRQRTMLDFQADAPGENVESVRIDTQRGRVDGDGAAGRSDCGHEEYSLVSAEPGGGNVRVRERTFPRTPRPHRGWLDPAPRR